jgi:tetratricopeptide (TPR) repeat protein
LECSTAFRYVNMAPDPTEPGKAAYRSGNYEEAIKLFGDAALKAPTRTKMQCLDLQAGSLIKVQKLAKALEIAKCLIRLDRTDARGYMRAAQVERLNERHDMATRWYQQGLKYVPQSDKLYPTMKASLGKRETESLARRLSARPMDPFATLPLEIARIILSHFDYRETTAILRVSKSWKTFLCREPVITETLDFSAARSTVTITQLKACLRRLTRYPTTAHLVNLSPSAITNLKSRLPQWLQRNTITSFSNTDMDLSLPIKSVPREMSLRLQRLKTASTLSDLDVLTRQSPALKTLELTLREYEGEASFPNLAADGSASSSSPLEHLRIECRRTPSLPRPPLIFLPPLPDLVSLDLLTIQGLLPSRKDEADLPFPKLRRLKLVDCIGLKFILPKCIEDLVVVRHCSRLIGKLDLPNARRIWLSYGGRSFEPDDLSWDCNKVEDMDLTMQALTDDHSELFTGLPHLRRLVIRNSHRLTALFAKSIIQAHPKTLEYLAFHNCDKVDRTIKQWASENYAITVEFGSDHPRDELRVWSLG